MNFIERIKKLKELRKISVSDPLDVVASGKWSCELHRAAPEILAILECFQEGDGQNLNDIAEFFEVDCDPVGDRYAAILRRLQEAARLMETNHESR